MLADHAIRRVKAILEPYKRWFGNSSTRDALVNTICDTRNYLTHYDEATILSPSHQLLYVSGGPQ